jgi:hypothetical protein
VENRPSPAAWLSLAAGQGITLAVLVGPVAGQPWLSGFRNYFSGDQFSYAAIATNGANGDLAYVEPFTQTGALYYPSLWYQVLGLVSHLTGLPVYVTWTLLGVLMVCLAVLVSGIAAWRLSRLWWSPLAPALALLTGTFATPLIGYWYLGLDNHAVLWGPFGTLFTLNAEVIGLSLITMSAVIVFSLGLRGLSQGRRSTWWLVAAGALVGVVANIQTYSFFTGVSFIALSVAAFGLLTSRSRRAAITTAALLILLLALGSLVAGVIGHIPVFGLLLLAISPGLLIVAKRFPAATAAFLIPLVILSAPQVIRTALGILEGDAFLTYRQASTQALGVPPIGGLIGGGVLVVLWFAVLIIPTRARPTWITAMLIGLGTGAVLMSSNDLWGFDQEPYRFWLQYFIVGSLLLSIIATVEIRAYLDDEPARRRQWRPAMVVGVLAFGLYAISLADVTGFWVYARDEGIFDLTTQESTQLSEVGQQGTGLIANGPCIDPQHLKLLTAAQVPYFNLGLAWPSDKAGITHVMNDLRAGELNLEAMRVAGVSYLVTDSTCETQWTFLPSDRVVPAAKAGPFTLWQLLPQ